MDEQTASYGKKVQEKRQEVERLKAIAEKAQNALTDKEREVAVLTRQLGQAQGQGQELQTKTESMLKAIDTMKCQNQNLKQVNDNMQAKLSGVT